MQKIIKELANELNIPEEDVLKTYKLYWKVVKDIIEKLPLKDKLNEEEFNKLRTSFNIPNLGKLYCTYEKYIKIHNKFNKANAKNKED